MKRSILLIFCFGLFFNLAFSQNHENGNLNQYQKDAITFKNYLDPTFPDPLMHKDIQDPAIADYAKQHPPIPLKVISGNHDQDQIEWESKVNDWCARNPYFPQFLEYHKFNYLLKAEDDVIFYNTAKKEWIKRNPDKFESK